MCCPVEEEVHMEKEVGVHMEEEEGTHMEEEEEEGAHMEDVTAAWCAACRSVLPWQCDGVLVGIISYWTKSNRIIHTGQQRLLK